MWTEEKDEKLRRLWDDKESVTPMILSMGCSYDECSRRVSELQKTSKGSKIKSKENDGLETREPTYIMSQERTVKLNLLCLRDRVGVVIGKSHRTINRIRTLSKAKIRINPCDNFDDVEDELISISAIEILEEHSPTEIAAFELLWLCCDEQGGSYRVRLLVDDAQNDCLDEEFLSIWRSITDAAISVYEREQNYEIQIIGERSAVERAFRQVVLRVRRQAFKF